MTRLPQFLHERLDAYRLALDLAAGVSGLIATYPRGLAKERDQIRRSATSVVRNLAEGASRRTAADKCQYFGIALAECAETHASLEIGLRCGYASETESQRLLLLASRVGAMLGGLLRRQQQRPTTGLPWA